MARAAEIVTLAPTRRLRRGCHWSALDVRPILRRMSPLLYMDAEIRPNRSLSERGFIVLIAVVTLANCGAAAVFIALGATLVPFFLAIDVLAIVTAFLVSFRAARRIERVQVSASEVRVTLETPRQSRLIWRSPTAFTRVHLEREDERAVALKLALSGEEAEVAAALSPRERADFAQALERAIWQARRERI
jgi:uncharacterized membrane protein